MHRTWQAVQNVPRRCLVRCCVRPGTPTMTCTHTDLSHPEGIGAQFIGCVPAESLRVRKVHARARTTLLEVQAGP